VSGTASTQAKDRGSKELQAAGPWTTAGKQEGHPGETEVRGFTTGPLERIVTVSGAGEISKVNPQR